MKTKIIVALIAISMTLVATTAIAVKPTGNPGAETVPWNLSGVVMPVPPYGSRDIAGSDTASKLIVNQPNGAVEVTITGAMNGLNPDTTYTVYLSNGYEPYVYTGWDVTGSWDINVELSGTNYLEKLILAQSGTTINGVSLNLIPPTSGAAFTITSGSVTGDSIDITLDHDVSPLVVHMEGTIATDGSSMSGTWADVAPGTRSGSWTSTSGTAIDHTGDDWWTGLFTSTIPPFTFTTDEYGAGSWHMNLRDSDFSTIGTYTLSVWINEVGGTILISDNFDVAVD